MNQIIATQNKETKSALNKKNLTILLRALIKQVDSVLTIATKNKGKQVDKKELTIIKSLYSAIFDFIIANLDTNTSAVKVLADELNDTVPSSLTLNYFVADDIFIAEFGAIKKKITQLINAGIIDDATEILDLPLKKQPKVGVREGLADALICIRIKINGIDAVAELDLRTNKNVKGYRFIRCELVSSDNKLVSSDNKLSGVIGNAIFVIEPGKIVEIYKDNKVIECKVNPQDIAKLDKLIQSNAINEYGRGPKFGQSDYDDEEDDSDYPDDEVDDTILSTDSQVDIVILVNRVGPKINTVDMKFFIYPGEAKEQGSFTGVYGIVPRKSDSLKVLATYNKKYDKFIIVPVLHPKSGSPVTGEPYEFLFASDESMKRLCNVLKIKADKKYVYIPNK